MRGLLWRSTQGDCQHLAGMQLAHLCRLLCHFQLLTRPRTAVYPSAPTVQFTVAGRAGQALNIAAENISESLLVAAVQRAADEALPRGCLDLQASEGHASE